MKRAYTERKTHRRTGDIKRDLSSDQLAGIGAVALAYNYAESSLDRALGLRSDRPTRILGIARAFGTSGEETDFLLHGSPHSLPVKQAAARAFAGADLLA